MPSKYYRFKKREVRGRNKSTVGSLRVASSPSEKCHPPGQGWASTESVHLIGKTVNAE